MDRRTLLAISLCLLIFLGWQKFYIEPRMPHPTSTTSTAPQVSGTTTEAGAPSHGTPPTISGETPSKQVQISSLPIRTSVGEASVGSGNNYFTDWRLKAYRLDISSVAAAVDLNSVTHTPGNVQLGFDDASLAYLNSVSGSLSKTPEGARWSYQDARVRITRDFKADEAHPYIDVNTTIEFKGAHPNFAFLSVHGQGFDKDPEAQDRQLVYYTGNSIERVHLKDNISLKEVTTPIHYIGATNRYFLLAAVNQSPLEPKGVLQGIGPMAGRMNLLYPVTGNSLSLPARIYFGPKELELLRAVDPTLAHSVDFGFFTVFAFPLLKILKWLYQFVHNYGVAIILLTLLLKVVTYPLTYKSMKNMKQMAKVQPQLQKIREKYKDDREALNREMLTLMRSHGYNPAAGCLPMIIQMPIFFALWRVLYSSIELYQAPFALWIHDLSARDPFYVTPILLSVTMFLQQKLTPTTGADPAQQKMLQFMPLIFGAFMITTPAGLAIYMVINSVASIAQQMFLNKKFSDGSPRPVLARAK